MKLLGIDPGESTGWGLVQFEPGQSLTVLEFGTTRDLLLVEIQDYIRDVDLVVLESWKTRPANARKGNFDWDPMITPQVIGAAKLQCQLLGTQVVEQEPSVKPMGYGFLRQEYKKGKRGMHSWDALAHAAFYAVRHGTAKPLGL